MKQSLHLKAPGNWINDPNGFIYYKGKYHLFYQHFPFAPVWGTMHWGHAVSDDLIHWEHLGVAIFPTKSYDCDGVFSGGAFELNGKLALYYTGVQYLDHEPDNIHIPLNDIYECSQAMITSEDGIHFDNYEDKKQIIPVIHDDSIANFNHTRDPKVWRQDGSYFMLLGSTYQKRIGRLLLLKSEDAIHWTITDDIFDKRFGRILECPDLFQLDDQNLLLISPMYIVPKSEGYEAQSMIGTVDFDSKNASIHNLSSFQFIDHGRDLYATQTCLDEEGRRVLFAWIRMPEAVRHSWDEKAWNGMMCLPRVIELHEDGIYFTIHPNVRKFFDLEIPLEKRNEFHPNQKDPCFIETQIQNGEAINIAGYRIWMSHGCLHTDRSDVFCKDSKLKRTFSIPSIGEKCKLSIILEPNLIEIFVNDGKYVLSNTVYDLKDILTGSIEKIFISSES